MPQTVATLKDVTDIAPRRKTLLCRLVRYQPWIHPNEYLLGHADADFSGWEIHRIPVFRRKDGTLSVGVPSAPQLDCDGAQLRDDDGKRRYLPMMSFSSDGKARWERAVLQALADAGISP